MWEGYTKTPYRLITTRCYRGEKLCHPQHRSCSATTLRICTNKLQQTKQLQREYLGLIPGYTQQAHLGGGICLSPINQDLYYRYQTRIFFVTLRIRFQFGFSSGEHADHRSWKPITVLVDFVGKMKIFESGSVWCIVCCLYVVDARRHAPSLRQWRSSPLFAVAVADVVAMDWIFGLLCCPMHMIAEMIPQTIMVSVELYFKPIGYSDCEVWL